MTASEDDIWESPYRQKTGRYQPDTRTAEDLQRRFTFHPSQGDQAYRYECIRDLGGTLANQFLRFCPASRELSLALTNLEQAVMWANAAIARNES